MMIIPEPTEIDKRMRRRGEADGDDDDVRWRERRRKMAENTADKKREFKPKEQKKQREVPRAKKGTRGSVQSVQFSSVACMCPPFVMQH